MIAIEKEDKVAIINFSVDTNSRQAIVTVGGQIIPAIACRLNKWIDMDGNPRLDLSYVVETKNENGLTERREFFLPEPDDDTVFASTETGMASRVITDKINADVDKYMKSRKCRS